MWGSRQGGDVHYHYHMDMAVLSGIASDIKLLLTKLDSLRSTIMALDAKAQASLDNLNAKVAEQTTIEQSVETLLNGLSAEIANLKTTTTDPAVAAALDAAAALVTANNDKFKAAVVANTPAA